MDWGKAIELYKEINGLSYSELSEITGRNRATLWQWSRRSIAPNSIEAMRFAEWLCGELVDYIKHASGVPADRLIQAAKCVEMLANAYRGMNQ